MPLAEFPNAPTPAQEFVQLPNHFPAVPAEIIERFTEGASWNDAITTWWKQTYGALSDATGSVTAVVNKNDEQLGNMILRVGDLTAEIAIIEETIITNYEVLARRIVTVSALAGSSSHITVSGAPPGAPALNDLWVNNTDPDNPVTYKWDGAAWVEVTVPISVAAVAAEQSARITADGYLEGKYSLTVIAGNVVTGMNITSASGPGTNISSVIFRATDFQIYNGVTGITMFTVSGTAVNLANVLTVSTSGKVFTGTGTYANANTYFYVDSSNRFSLGANLTWDGATLTITGSISATSGTIGGWTVGATTLTGGNATLDSAGQLFLGTASNVVYLSATDATYRLWVGNVTAGSATFSVTKAGALFSTSGTIGGFTIATSKLSAGSGVNYVELNSSAASGLTVGDLAGAALILKIVSSVPNLSFSNTDTSSAATLYTDPVNGGGHFELYNSAGSSRIVLTGYTGAITATTLAITGQCTVGAGSDGAPGYAFAGATDYGYWKSGTSLRFVTAGTARFSIDSTTASFSAAVGAVGVITAGSGSNSAPGFGFGSGTNYGMYLSGSNLAFTTNGTLRGYFDTSYNFVVTNGTVNMLMSIDTGSSRGTIGTGTNHSLEVITNSAIVWFFGSDGHFKSNGGDIRKVSSDNWTVKLYDGTSELEFQASGGQIYGRINGGGAILLG